MPSRKGALCSLVGCMNRVNGYSSLCVKHDHRRKRCGSPTARCLRKRDLESHADVVAEALEQHRDNPSVIAAHDMAARLLSINIGETGEVMRRLRFAGVTPRQLLVGVGSVWSYFLHGDDGKVLTFALAHRVSHLAPLPTRPALTTGRPTPVRPGARVLARLGFFLRNKFGAFFSQLLAASQRAVDEERRLLAEMSRPMETEG